MVATIWPFKDFSLTTCPLRPGSFRVRARFKSFSLCCQTVPWIVEPSDATEGTDVHDVLSNETEAKDRVAAAVITKSKLKSPPAAPSPEGN